MEQEKQQFSIAELVEMHDWMEANEDKPEDIEAIRTEILQRAESDWGLTIVDDPRLWISWPRIGSRSPGLQPNEAKDLSEALSFLAYELEQRANEAQKGGQEG